MRRNILTTIILLTLWIGFCALSPKFDGKSDEFHECLEIKLHMTGAPCLTDYGMAVIKDIYCDGKIVFWAQYFRPNLLDKAFIKLGLSKVYDLRS